MKQLTVAYLNLDQINNHELLLPSIEITTHILQDPIHVVVHRDPICQMTGSKVLTNYDFVVTPEHQNHLVRNVVLERYSKLTQAARLSEAVRAAGRFPNFVPISCWDNRFSTHNDAESFRIDKVVIKALHGARGICQLLVSDVAKINKATLLNEFQKVMSEFNDLPITTINAEEYNEAFRQHLKAKFPYNALWAGLEQGDFANANSMMCPAHYFMQEYRSNILKEYRVLVGMDKELYCFERGLRTDRPFAQATGTNKSIYTKSIPALSEQLEQELVDFLTTVIPGMNSVDLVLFETPAGIQYGVFEYCNQFGMDVDDPAIFKKLHSDFILHYAKIYRPDLFV